MCVVTVSVAVTAAEEHRIIQTKVRWLVGGPAARMRRRVGTGNVPRHDAGGLGRLLPPRLGVGSGRRWFVHRSLGGYQGGAIFGALVSLHHLAVAVHHLHHLEELAIQGVRRSAEPSLEAGHPSRGHSADGILGDCDHCPEQDKE